MFVEFNLSKRELNQAKCCSVHENFDNEFLKLFDFKATTIVIVNGTSLIYYNNLN